EHILNKKGVKPEMCQLLERCVNYSFGAYDGHFRIFEDSSYGIYQTAFEKSKIKYKELSKLLFTDNDINKAHVLLFDSIIESPLPVEVNDLDITSKYLLLIGQYN